LDLRQTNNFYYRTKVVENMFGINKFQLLVLAYITFGSGFYGYDSGITTSVLAYENFLTYFALNNNT
jgi:hypothetical protein